MQTAVDILEQLLSAGGIVSNKERFFTQPALSEVECVQNDNTAEVSL